MCQRCRYAIKVSGRVQGVGYRAFVAKAASRLDVSGFVKNLQDGSVQIEAEQTQVVLMEFLNICKQGPGWGRVDRLEYVEIPTDSSLGFRIRN
ncbi:MAG: acylphosphatase [Cyclobacteriaceae bacterium]|nr:acylphosphatase [Cyclobacteriaceae bacterium]